jgi:phosphoglycolate phosphatase-like HAD superfamily hydrolase
MRSAQPMTALLALDFDGVICDSVRETALTALKAAHALCPDEVRLDPIPENYFEKFQELRPALESGFESILLALLVLRDESKDEVLQHTKRSFNRMMDQLGVTREQLIELHHCTRTKWMQSDLAGWLAYHSFYTGTADLLRSALNEHSIEPYIITTKSREFALKLLAEEGIQWPEARIYGFGSGPKVETLNKLAKNIKGTTKYTFIEDRVKTLRTVAKDQSLNHVNLYLASWGYNSETDRDFVESSERFKLLELKDIETLLKP